MQRTFLAPWSDSLVFRRLKRSTSLSIAIRRLKEEQQCQLVCVEEVYNWIACKAVVQSQVQLVVCLSLDNTPWLSGEQNRQPLCLPPSSLGSNGTTVCLDIANYILLVEGHENNSTICCMVSFNSYFISVLIDHRICSLNNFPYGK